MDIGNLGEAGLDGALLNTISRFVGGSPEATKKTLSASIPTAMASLTKASSSICRLRLTLSGRLTATIKL